MTYADLTWADPNPIKRFLQLRRLSDAVRLADAGPAPPAILDYGGGDGRLCGLLERLHPAAAITCFEPVARLRGEAAATLGRGSRVRLVADDLAIGTGTIDLAFCTEVFEHLPLAETERAIAGLARVLRPGGTLIVGVPVEVGPPALAKGVLRRMRRPEAPDADLAAILTAAGGTAPTPRTLVQIAEGLPYYPHHLGFDWRVLRERLKQTFDLRRLVGSPLAWLPVGLNSEAYMVLTQPEPRRPCA